MRIRIDKIIDDIQMIIVGFTSEFGSADAVWKGSKPTEESTYEVEIEICKTLTWGQEILLSSMEKPAICGEDNVILITGCIDSYDEDGYTMLRLNGNLISFISIGMPFENGTYVTLIVDSISLTHVEY